MTAADPAAKLSTLLNSLRRQHAESAGAIIAPCNGYVDAAEPLLCEFVRAFLVWESTTAKAAAAIKRLEAAVVDFNELRICMPDELIRMLGKNYPRAEERAQRLRAALNDLYARQHAVTLEHLTRLSKRDAKEFLDSLEGVPRFVLSRVLLLTQSGHAAPIDSRIHRRLIEAGIVETDSTPEEAAGQLEKRIRAGEMLETYSLLQAWADELPVSSSSPHHDEPARHAHKAAGTSAAASNSGHASKPAPKSAPKVVKPAKKK